MAARDAVEQILYNTNLIKKWMGRQSPEFGHLFQLLTDITTDCHPLLNRISDIFPEYTPHDLLTHCTNVLDVLNWVIPSDTYEDLSDYDIFFLATASILHDIGMAAGVDRLELIRSSKSFSEFSSRIHEAENEFISDKDLIREFIRLNHHEYSAEWIRTYFDRLDPGLGEVLALIVESHGTSIEQLSSSDKYSSTLAFKPGRTADIQFLSIILRIGDLFDLTLYRTPWVLYDFIHPRGYSSLVEWKKHLSTIGIARHPEKDGIVVVNAICNEPEIYHHLRRFELYVRNQIKGAASYLLSRKNPRDVDIYDVEFRISTRGFVAKDWVFDLSRHAIFDLLMGHRLYSNPLVAIRELVQNSIDAVRQRAKTSPSHYQPRISLSLERVEKEWILTVDDNGIGMDENIIENFFLKAGKPYYQSTDYKRSYKKEERIEPIGQFGIGFVSAFMLSDHITVETFKLGGQALRLEITDILSYLVVKPLDMASPGTRISLRLKPEIMVRTVEAEHDESARQLPESLHIDKLDDIYARMSRRAMSYESLPLIWAEMREGTRDPQLSDLVNDHRDPRDPCRVVHTDRGISLICLEAVLDHFAGFLEFPIRFREAWDSDFHDFHRSYRKPPAHSSVLEANIGISKGIYGRIVCHMPGTPLFPNFGRISQNGLRVHMLERLKIAPNWCPVSYLELDLSGPDRVQLLTSREEISSTSESMLKNHIDKLVGDIIANNIVGMRSDPGFLQFITSTIWRYFSSHDPKIMQKFTFRTPSDSLETHFSVVKGATVPRALPIGISLLDDSDFANFYDIINSVADYLPLPVRSPMLPELSTITDMGRIGHPVRIVVCRTIPSSDYPGSYTEVFAFPNPCVLSHLLPALQRRVNEVTEISDCDYNISISSSTPRFLGPPLKYEHEYSEFFDIYVPRLMISPILNSNLFVQQTGIFGLPIYVLNENHPIVKLIEKISSEKGWLVHNYNPFYNLYDVVPAIEALIDTFDQLSRTKSTDLHPNTLLDQMNHILLELVQESHLKIRKLTVKEFPSSWIRNSKK